MENKRVCGVCRFFHRLKSFGFIETEDGQELFVSWRDLEIPETYKYLTDGEQVTFEIMAQPNRERGKAIKVRRATNDNTGEVKHGKEK